MPKLYVISDVHGFYDEMKSALDEAGFDPNNEDHWLVSLGDALDRGPKPQEVIDYLMGMERCVLVKGNHDLLMMDCLQRGFPQGYDYSNGTFQSIVDLAPSAKTFSEACTVAYAKAEPFVNKMVNYFETERFVFCHSFIALKCDDELPAYYTRNRKFEYDPDWRYAHNSAWETAMWGNPYELADMGYLPNKTLVFGHFHTSWPRHYYEGKPEFGADADFSIYYGDGYIAIDGCTAASGIVNCLVIEDEFING